MKKYRLMTKDEFIMKYGSMYNVPSPGWNNPNMNMYFGIDVTITDKIIGSRFSLDSWTFSHDWLVEIDEKTKIRTDEKTKQSSQTKLKLISNVIIKLDQNK